MMAVSQPNLRFRILVPLALTLAGCSPIPGTEVEFRKLLGTSDINTTIILGGPTASNSGGAGYLIVVGVTNQSRHWVAFPPEYGAVGYKWVEATGLWEEVPNSVESPDVRVLLGPAEGPDSSNGILFFSPGSTWPASGPLRIAVRGALRNDDGSLGKEVAAYIDVLPP